VQEAASTIQELHKEMNDLRGANASDENSLSKFVQNDYFYKELSGKPKVSFAPQIAGADPVDAIMNQRLSRNQPTTSALKRSNTGDRRKSFVTNVNLVRSLVESVDA